MQASLPTPTDPNSALPGTFQWHVHEYTNTYFTIFHPVWPFLHRGTFDPLKEPRVIVQSVLMIGLWIDGKKEARDAAIEIYHRQFVAINSQRVSRLMRLMNSDLRLTLSTLGPMGCIQFRTRPECPDIVAYGNVPGYTFAYYSCNVHCKREHSI